MNEVNPNNPIAYSNVPIGTILAYTGAAANAYNTGWLPCDGTTKIPNTCLDLLSLFPNGVTPKLNGLVLVGSGKAASGTTYTTNQGPNQPPIGEESHTLSIEEMPAHDHSMNFFAQTFDGGDYYNSAAFSGDIKTSVTGGGAPHNNMQPYYVVTYIIYAGPQLNSNPQ